MALRRFLFAYDATDPMLPVLRYIATGAPENFIGGVTCQPGARMPDPHAQGDRFAYARQQFCAIREIVARSPLLDPSKWAAIDADLADVPNPSPSTLGGIPAVMAAAGPHGSVRTFMHAADTELALAHLAQARALSLASIAALPTWQRQRDAVVSKWQHFAAYFRALNVRPWGWAKLRGRWETEIGQWGGLAHADRFPMDPRQRAQSGGQFLSTRPVIGDRINAASTHHNPIPGEWSDLLFQDRPTPLRVNAPASGAGAMRDEAYRRWRAWTAPDEATDARHLRFGSDSALDGVSNCLTKAGIEIGTEVWPTQYTGPSGDAHPLWLCNSALLGGGVNYDPSCYVDLQCYAHIDCVRRNLTTGTTSPPTITAPAGANWLCGATDGIKTIRVFVGPTHFGWDVAGDAAQIASSVGISNIYRDYYACYVPPLLWYAQLIEPLCDYLATIDPLALVYEVQTDVVGKNLWTMISCGEDVSTLITEGAIAGTARLDASAAVASRLFAIGYTGAGLAGMINPMVGAIAGAVVAFLNIVHDLLPKDGAGPLDVFGRTEPAIDNLAIVSTSRSADRYRVQAIMPEPAIPTATATQSSAPSGPPSLTIHGMPQNGHVFLDGQEITVLPGATWLDAAMTTWRIPLPSATAGAHHLRIIPVSGDAMASDVEIRGGTDVTFSPTTTALALNIAPILDLAPGRTIVRILGLPGPGTFTVDGHPVTPKWSDATHTAQEVPVTPGAHTIRVTVGRDTRTVQVNAAAGQTLTGHYATMTPVRSKVPLVVAGVAVAGGLGYALRKRLGF